MFGKIFAGIVMGIIVAILAHIVFGLGSGGGAEGASRGSWAALAGFILMIGLAVTAAKGRFAWGRGLLLCGLLCLAMPLASIAMSGIIGAQSMAQAGTEAGRAGAAIGTVLAGGALTFISGVIGFFLGLIFLVGSYFALRKT